VPERRPGSNAKTLCEILMTDRDKIDNCKNLFVTTIYEPAQNQLSIEVALGQVSQIEEDFPIGNKSLSGYRIFFDDTSEKYRLHFHSYISYFIVNEGFELEETGKYSGDRIREYQQSSFIDFCKQQTFAFEMIEESTIKHFMIVTQNHIVNILTASPLDITAIQ